MGDGAGARWAGVASPACPLAGVSIMSMRGKGLGPEEDEPSLEGEGSG